MNWRERMQVEGFLELNAAIHLENRLCDMCARRRTYRGHLLRT